MPFVLHLLNLACFVHAKAPQGCVEALPRVLTHISLLLLHKIPQHHPKHLGTDMAGDTRTPN